MTWVLTNWASDGGGIGDGSSGGGEMRVHGSDMHDATVPKIIHPNLLYNSTGMMNLGGWINTTKVINYRDEFIIDDFSYFLLTGNTEGSGFSCQSLPLKEGVVHTFSGTFVSEDILRISMFFQDQTGVNDFSKTIGSVILFEQNFPNGTARVEASFTPPVGTYAGYLCIEYLATDEAHTATLSRMKIEESATATDWVPCLTDPYQNNIVIQPLNAAALLKGI
jgi:hypothetical protein